MFKEHYSDAHLISVLYREMGPFSRFEAAWHLRGCETCRRRRDVLRERLEAREADPASPAVTEQARQRFLAWARTVRFESPAQPWYGLAGFLRAPAMAAAGAFVLIGGIGVWQQLHKEQNEASVPQPVLEAPLAAPVPPPVVARRKETHEWLQPPAMTFLKVPEPVVIPGPQTEELEVEVWSILHRAGACQGEPIEIVPMPGHSIAVRGIVPRARRNQLARLLSLSSRRQWIRMELDATEDLLARLKATRLEPGGSATVASVRNHEFDRALMGTLKGMYPEEAAGETRRRLTEMSNAAIGEIERASSEAWAIRRLQTRFTEEASGELSAESQAAVAEMARDHAGGLRRHVSELSKGLAPVLSKLAEERTAASGESDLFADVERLRVLVESGLAGATPYDGSPAQLSGEILALASAIEADLATAFPSH